MEIRNLLLPKYKETFPEDLLPALLRYISELAGTVHDMIDGDIKEDCQVWCDYDLMLQDNFFDHIPTNVDEMPIFQAYETYGECEVMSYKMCKWIDQNVTDFDSRPLKLLSIINLDRIPKSDAVVVSVDKENECLDITVDFDIMQEESPIDDNIPLYNLNQSLGYFTWPKELLPLYQK